MGFEVTIDGLSRKRAELVLELESAQARVADLYQQQRDVDLTLDVLAYDATGKIDPSPLQKTTSDYLDFNFGRVPPSGLRASVG